MILENNPDFTYAILLVADYHKEYPLLTPATIAWDPYELQGIAEAVGHDEINGTTIDAMTNRIFGDLPTRYNGSYDPGMSIWRIQGSRNELTAVFNDLAQQLMGGPRGADDDTYDYWPNAFDMLCVLAKDLITLNPSGAAWIFDTVRRVVDSAIALEGPPSEWEADFLDDNLNELAEILANLVKEREGS